MRNFWNRITGALGRPSVTPGHNHPQPETGNDEDTYWQQVYEARSALFREHLGDLPDDILKLGHLFGVWPGGGLFAIPATKIGSDVWAYTTFGLTNPDMPTSVTTSNPGTKTDDQGRVIQWTSTLQAKQGKSAPAGAAGYGYELLVLARESAEWPLWILQWAVNAELLNDVGLLKRVEQYQGLTVEELQIGGGDSVNILISKAQPPLPSTLHLPNGKMEFLVVTTITDEEMRWSMEAGRMALLEKLTASGVGQFSVQKRAPVTTAVGG